MKSIKRIVVLRENIYVSVIVFQIQEFGMISIITPAYNEGSSLVDLFDRCKAVLQKQDEEFEFWIIDDGSADDTFEVAEKLWKSYNNVGVIRMESNHGKSMALTQGFLNCKSDTAITIDADLQDMPEMIPRLLKKRNDYDLVCGCRVNRRDGSMKRLLSKMFNFITRLMFRIKLKDINCGFKAYSRKLYQTLKLWGGLHRLSPILAIHKGFKVGEVKIEHDARKYGKSKYKLFRHKGLIAVLVLRIAGNKPLHPFRHLLMLGAVLGALAGVLIWTITAIPPFNSPSPGIGVILLSLLAVCFGCAGVSFPIIGYKMENKRKQFFGSDFGKNFIRKILHPRKRNLSGIA